MAGQPITLEGFRQMGFEKNGWIANDQNAWLGIAKSTRITMLCPFEDKWPYAAVAQEQQKSQFYLLWSGQILSLIPWSGQILNLLI